MARERITAIFPGQGGLKPGLGEEAFTKSKEARKIFFLASSEVGEDLGQIAFGSQTDKLTEQSQMVRTAASLAEFEYAKERGLRIAGAGGHSVGQIAALGALEVIPRADLFAITRVRQEAMQYANKENPGLMVAATGITADMASAIAERAKATWANRNARDQHVFSGLIHVEDLHITDRIAGAIETAKEEAAAAGAKIKRIRLRPLGAETGPAHSEHQKPGEPMLAEKVYELKHNFAHVKPGVFLANSVRWLTSPDDIAEEIISGLTHGVDWHGQMAEYYQSGYRSFYETPSSDVLTGLIKRDYVVKMSKKRYGQLVQIVEPKPFEENEEN